MGIGIGLSSRLYFADLGDGTTYYVRSGLVRWISFGYRYVVL